MPGAQTIEKDGMLLFSSTTGTAISVSDFDAGSNPIQVTLTATNGTLNLSGTKGLTFTPPADGTADATMTFTGTRRRHQCRARGRDLRRHAGLHRHRRRADHRPTTRAIPAPVAR